MDSQSVTQTINVLVGGDLASTGISLLPLIGAAIVLITSGIVAFRFMRRSHKAFKLSFRSFGILALLTVFGASVALSSHGASAAPTLTLAANQNELTVTVPEGGGTASTTTTLTSGTTNPDGYTLTAALSEAEPGIAIKLKGGDVATSTALTAGAPALTLKTTTSASSNDTTTVTLDFTIDNTVTPGKKDLKLAYVATDNGSTGPLTMQSFTTSDCNALTTYTGSNEEAVITLSDPRGNGATYQVAKLADGHCWMLNNLKLASTTGTLTLTPSDSDVASNFTLPQLYNGSSYSFDDPYVYGPVPGDTGSGETNYGYLYNWPAATAGETQESMPAGSGNALHSICPANWKLPTAMRIYDEDEEEYVYSGNFPGLDRAFGGTGAPADNTGPNYAQWQYTGAFKGVLSGFWLGEFGYQGQFGAWWSASAHPDGAVHAFVAVFVGGGVSPAGDNVRPAGFGVRCLLQ